MTNDPIEPLDPGLAALLASERLASTPPSRIAQIWSRVAAASIGAPELSNTVKAPPSRHGWLASHAAGVATAAFVAGGGVGAALYAGLEKPAPANVVYVERPIEIPPTTPATIPTEPLVAPPSRAAPLPSAAPPGASQPIPPAASSSGSLAAERALLQDARRELGRGDAERALSLLAEHSRRFSKAQLAEEREALLIQSLVTLGRYDEARAKASRFKTASPQSLFLPAIEASLESIP